MESNEHLKLLTFVVRISVFSVCGSLVYYMYRYWINGQRYRKEPESRDKVVIVTGASRGIGKEVARGLAKRGLYVILTCNNMEHGVKTQNEIIKETGNPNVKCMHLNLGSFQSIRIFAEKFLRTGLPLDILINNAQVMRLKRQTTVDGIEENIGLNYMGHFLLTMLLIRRMADTVPTRVINVSNWVHRCIDIDPTDLMYEHDYCGFLAYARSQLANVYFTFALSKRIENTGITCNCVHTGVSLANFVNNHNFYPWWLPKTVAVFLAKILCKTEHACADSIIYAAVDFSCQNVSGVYLSNTQFGHIGDNANNEYIMEWLWKRSEEITSEKLCELPNNFWFLKKSSF